MTRICITMGDPAGVGPELCIRLLDRNKKAPALLVVGDLQVLKTALAKFGREKSRRAFKNAKIATGDSKLFPAAPLTVLSLSRLDPKKIIRERASIKHGLASWKYIEAGVRLCRSGACDALLTMPVNKESMLKAGCPYPGHTQLLAALDRSKSEVMLMVLDRLRVALVTHHIALKKVPQNIAAGKILSILKIMAASLTTEFRIKRPRIGVLGLNPHAGEDGALGDEEIKIISPAIRLAQKSGINATGPFPADTVFHRARSGEFDALLAMYHDQGIGPLKTLEFEKVVNVTLGLSFVRPSPGHGTAYTIAWTGKADPSSSFAAFDLALKLARNRKRSDG
jgi:4-hydroxythreonine-4-phosphate dehydrogenase